MNAPQTVYEKLSAERKELQSADLMPASWTTGSWQLFKERYLYDAANPREQYERIARTLARHTPDPAYFQEKFFQYTWDSHIYLSTPVLANTGTSRGLVVSCAGSQIDDSIYGIYEAKKKIAMLTKMGFGTSSDLSKIRPRGAQIHGGGVAMGVLPVLQGIQQDMSYVSQGTARRGGWAGYLDVTHGDFSEVCTYLEQHPDGNNIGWNISKEVIQKWEERDPEYLKIWQQMMRTKMIVGKGYFFKPDAANARRPKCYVDRDLKITHSNLCSEITLFDGLYAEPEKVYFDLNDRNYIEVEAGKQEDHIFTCVLSGANLATYDSWPDDLIYILTIMLDCVCQEFIERARNVRGLEDAVRFTLKSRALGLGVCGFHSYLISKGIPMESFEAHLTNNLIFKHIHDESERASRWLADQYGEPLWAKGTGLANTHRIAIAPTKSSAMFVGAPSEGINPEVGMVFTQRTAGGEIDRVNPYLLKIMKERGVYTKEVVTDIRERYGSVQHVTWLSDHEKRVFKTAFEMDMEHIIRLASARSKYLCQWQSLNLYFAHNASPQRVNDINKMAMLDDNIVAIYYVYSQAAIQGSTGRSVMVDQTKLSPTTSTTSTDEDPDMCVACQ